MNEPCPLLTDPSFPIRIKIWIFFHLTILYDHLMNVFCCFSLHTYVTSTACSYTFCTAIVKQASTIFTNRSSTYFGVVNFMHACTSILSIKVQYPMVAMELCENVNLIIYTRSKVNHIHCNLNLCKIQPLPSWMHSTSIRCCRQSILE